MIISTVIEEFIKIQQVLLVISQQTRKERSSLNLTMGIFEKTTPNTILNDKRLFPQGTAAKQGRLLLPLLLTIILKVLNGARR